MALAELDEIWLRCARRLGVKVARGGDAYVHFDGELLHISDDSTLDDDDSLAQLVFHELCHMITQGAENRWVPDWGMDNRVQSSRDDLLESAAVRLQAHLAGTWGLRPWLFPTTVVRRYFDSLPHDAIEGGPQDGSIPIVRRATARLRDERLRQPLDEALRETVIALALPLHASGRPLVDGADPRTCGTCGWRSEESACLKASGHLSVTVLTRACAGHEAAPDCLRCGACCRSGYDVVLISPDELLVKARPDLVVGSGPSLELLRSEGRCAALAPDSPYACSLYELRPSTCREFQKGSDHCLQARRRVGLSP